MNECSGRLTIGSKVQVLKFQGDPRINGATGYVLERKHNGSTYVVRLDVYGIRAIQVENLKVIK